VDDLFNGVHGEDPPTGRGKCFWGIGQSNVTCRKNVALQCGCSVSVAESDWTRMQWPVRGHYTGS